VNASPFFWLAVSFAVGMNIAAWSIAVCGVLRMIREARRNAAAKRIPRRNSHRRPVRLDERDVDLRFADVVHESRAAADPDPAWLAGLPAAERCESAGRTRVLRDWLARAPRLPALIKRALTTNTNTKD
jgi:Zn-dependent protease with chaperone function